MGGGGGGARLCCGALGLVRLGWRWGGGGQVGVFSSSSGRVLVGPPILFCADFAEAPNRTFLVCFASTSGCRDQITEKKKIGWGCGVGDWWSRFWVVAVVFGLLGVGWGEVLVCCWVLLVVAFWCWRVLRSARTLPIGLGSARGSVWPRLAGVPVCFLLRRPGSCTSLGGLLGRHDKYGFSSVGPKDVLVGPPFQFVCRFF